MQEVPCLPVQRRLRRRRARRCLTRARSERGLATRRAGRCQCPSRPGRLYRLATTTKTLSARADRRQVQLARTATTKATRTFRRARGRAFRKRVSRSRRGEGALTILLSRQRRLRARRASTGRCALRAGLRASRRGSTLLRWFLSDSLAVSLSQPKLRPERRLSRRRLCPETAELGRKAPVSFTYHL
jgi:hypothetical protein